MKKVSPDVAEGEFRRAELPAPGRQGGEAEGRGAGQNGATVLHAQLQNRSRMPNQARAGEYVYGLASPGVDMQNRTNRTVEAHST